MTQANHLLFPDEQHGPHEHGGRDLQAHGMTRQRPLAEESPRPNIPTTASLRPGDSILSDCPSRSALFLGTSGCIDCRADAGIARSHCA
jgi:hypothetical protein